MGWSGYDNLCRLRLSAVGLGGKRTTAYWNLSNTWHYDTPWQAPRWQVRKFQYLFHENSTALTAGVWVRGFHTVVRSLCRLHACTLPVYPSLLFKVYSPCQHVPTHHWFFNAGLHLRTRGVSRGHALKLCKCWKWWSRCGSCQALLGPSERGAGSIWKSEPEPKKLWKNWSKTLEFSRTLE